MKRKTFMKQLRAFYYAISQFAKNQHVKLYPVDFRELEDYYKKNAVNYNIRLKLIVGDIKELRIYEEYLKVCPTLFKRY